MICLKRKLTLPALYVLNTTKNEEAQEIAIKVKEGTATLDEIAHLISFIKENGGIEYAVQTMNVYKQKAFQSIGFFAGFRYLCSSPGLSGLRSRPRKIVTSGILPEVNSTIITGPNLLSFPISSLFLKGNSCLFLLLYEDLKNIIWRLVLCSPRLSLW